MTTTQTAPPAPSTGTGTGIRVATAVVGGAIAVFAIGVAALGQFGIAGAATSQATEAIPTSVTSIDISNSVGDITVFSTPGAEPSVDIRTEAFAMNRSAPPTVEIDGDELSIDVADRDGPCWFACWGSVTIIIELGSHELDELDLSSDVGTIAVHEAHIGELTAQSDVGDVRAVEVIADTIELGSDVGSVLVTAAEATRSITVTTNVGDIEIGVQPGVDYDVRASSEIGDVMNEIVASTSTSASRSITATSDVGIIRIFVSR